MPDANQKEQFKAMANEIGRLKIESLAASAGAIDASKVYETVWKNAKCEIDANGIVKVVPVDEKGERLRMPNGEDMSVGQFIQTLKESSDTGYLFADGAASKSKKTPSGFDKEVNPWLPEFHNLSEQARLMRTEPAFAQRLKAAAEAIRDTSNPFSDKGHNLTKQSQLLRDDPATAEKLRIEARGSEAQNPWVTGNLTLQVLTIRSNPDLAVKQKAEAKAFKAANGISDKKDYRFVPPPGSFRRRLG